MNCKNLLIFLFLLFFISNSFAQNNKGVLLSETDNLFHIVKSNKDGITINHTIDEVSYNRNIIKGNDFMQINILSSLKSSEIGCPELPIYQKLIQIPVDAGVVLQDLTFSEEIFDINEQINGLKIKPVQVPLTKSDNKNRYPLAYNEKIYNTNKYYNKQVVKIETLGYLRTMKIVRVTINPVQYNPAQNKIKLIKDISFNLTFDYSKNDGDKYKYKSLAYQSSYFDNLNDNILHLDSNIKSRNTNSPVRFVIVSHPMFKETLQPFIEWKTKKGFEVIEAYTDDEAVGNTKESIKAYLKLLYDNASVENPAPVFGLIVGDVEQVPTFIGEADAHVTDLYYFEYTNDYLPDMYYGRFSVQSIEQLQVMINKTLAYEKFELQETSYLNDVLLVAGVDPDMASTYGNGQINYATTYYFNNEHDLQTHAYLYPESGSAHAAILEHVNLGVTIANYTAHCSSNGWADPSFSISDINTLTNNNKYGLLIGNCCQSSTYGNSECFSEKIVRAENKGALAYIGASNYSYWDEDFYFAVGAGSISVNPLYENTGLGAYDRLFHDNNEDKSDWFVTNGQIIFAGNLAVSESSSTSDLYYWEMYNLIGDPSVSMFIGEPNPQSPQFAETIVIGITSINIVAEPYSYVALSKSNQLISAGETDQYGTITLQLPDSYDPGNFDVVITKQNFIPFFGTISAIPSNTPYIICNDFIVIDSSGNNNNLADFSETIKLKLGIENFGLIGCEDILFTLRSQDPYVEIIDSTYSLDSIQGEQSLTLNNIFKIIISDTIPDAYNVDFKIIAKSGSDEWISSFSLKVNAPNIEIHSVVFDDILGGNGNGKFDAGETGVLNFIVNNNGHYNADSLVFKIVSDNEDVSFFENIIVFDSLLVDAVDTLKIIVAISPRTTTGAMVLLNGTITSRAYNFKNSFVQKVGVFVEDFESGDFTIYDWDSVIIHKWEVISASDLPDQNVPFNSGEYITKSKAISINSFSELKISIDVLADDSISFYKKVSSEAGDGAKFDCLDFLIDNESVKFWDGEDDWSYERFPVSAGNHTFIWKYLKDGYVTEGDDCAWLDNISLPVHDVEVVNENTVPYFEGNNPDSLAYRDSIYEYSFEAQDSESDIITSSLVYAPDFLSLEDLGHSSYQLSGIADNTYYGDYLIILSVSDGELFNYKSFTINVKYPVGIADVNNSENILIYPNPANNFINIYSDTQFDNKLNVAILDYIGRKVSNNFSLKTINKNQITISLPSLKSGVYFVIINDGQKQTIKKIIINRQ